MPTKKLLDGNHAAAYGAKLARAEVLGIYPITPQTELANQLADFVASGEMKAKYITVESEHSAMSVCAGGSAAGARVFTASSSQGIVFMEELLWQVPGMRLPVVMGIVNRSIAFPGSLRPDHNDSLLQRDNGWIQIYCENAQEIIDACIQAYRIAEDSRVYLPVIFAYDGYVISHTAMPVEVPDQDDVDRFLPPYKHEYVYLDPKRYKPVITHEPFQELGVEYRYQMEEAQNQARHVIKEVDREYGKIFGRSYGGLIEKYRCEDARAVLVTMGSITGTARVVVDEMRNDGKPIGLVKLRVFRPFPVEEMQELGRSVKAIGFVDRNISHGSAGGGVGTVETARALYSLEVRPVLIGFYAGLVGRDVLPSDIRYMAERVLRAAETGKPEKQVEWIGLRKQAEQVQVKV